DGVPIATEKKPTNLVWDPSSTAFCLLETRLRRADSRKRIRERLSRTKDSGDQAVSPEVLGASRLPSFARAFLKGLSHSGGWPWCTKLTVPAVRQWRPERRNSQDRLALCQHAVLSRPHLNCHPRARPNATIPS